MALIRVTGKLSIAGEDLRNREIILNTSHVVYATEDHEAGHHGCVVHMMGNEVLILDMPFDELWMLIQRET